jgi:site-specific DNA recombinase
MAATKAKQKTAVIYARYSSVMQDGSSIDGQILACRKIAEQYGLKIIGVPFEDRAKSGQSEDGRIRGDAGWYSESRLWRRGG